MVESPGSPYKLTPPLCQTPERSGLPLAVLGIGLSAANARAADAQAIAQPSWMTRPDRIFILRPARRGWSCKLLAAAWEGHFPAGHAVGAIFRRVSSNRHRIAHLQVVTREPGPLQGVRRVLFPGPLRDMPARILHVHVNVDMRVGPLDLDDHASKGDVLAVGLG